MRRVVSCAKRLVLACKPSDLRYMGTMRGKHKSGKAIDVHGYKLTAPEGEPQHLCKARI